jgi:pimeloyl-ACP methyl ester carboxylesterase
MAYASVNGLQLYYEIRGSGRPLVLLHGGLLTIDLSFGPLLGPLASADAHRPPGRESAPLDEGRLPTPADFRAWRDAYEAVAPDPAHFAEFAAKNSAMVHEFAGWTDELRSLRMPTLLIFGDRDFTPLPHVVELFELLPDAQLAVLPGTTHVGVTRRSGAVLALITPFLDAR